MVDAVGNIEVDRVVVVASEGKTGALASRGLLVGDAAPAEVDRVSGLAAETLVTLTCTVVVFVPSIKFVVQSAMASLSAAPSALSAAVAAG